MEPGAKVKLRGVEVGRVAAVTGGSGHDQPEAGDLPRPDRLHPGQCGGRDQGHDGVRRQVRRSDPSGQPQLRSDWLRARCCVSRNVSTEVNTVFENLVGLLNQIDVAKLNATLTALADGVRGQGERIGEATTDANQVLLAINPRMDTIAAGLALVQRVQRRLRRCGPRHSGHAGRGQHHQHDRHQPRQGSGCVAAQRDWFLQQRHRPARARTRTTSSTRSTGCSRRPIC